MHNFRLYQHWMNMFQNIFFLAESNLVRVFIIHVSITESGILERPLGISQIPYHR